MEYDEPNDFAYLPVEIVTDICTQDVPDRVELLEPLATLSGTWGDVTRSKYVFDSAYDDKEYYARADLCADGRRRTYLRSDLVALKNDWSSFSFGHVTLSDFSSEATFRILPLCFGKIFLTGNHCAKQINAVLEALLERPITHITISQSQLQEGTRDLFKKFIMKPSVRSVRVHQQSITLKLPESIENDLYEFVKKPNFLELEAPLNSIPKLLDYWNSLTTFPNHMQRVRFSQPLTSELGRDIAARNPTSEGPLQCSCKDELKRRLNHAFYYYKHPNDRSKFIEVFIENPSIGFRQGNPSIGRGFTEMCLTSGFASEVTEFLDYGNFFFRSSQEAYYQDDRKNLEIKCIKNDYVGSMDPDD
uniref:F-box domain-containing protein n=1 Tax=Steinernema glaseri TaxID=37863 RepID=A0A1I7Y1L3_9BILA